MVEREHELPISEQAKVLYLSRGSVYYKPHPVSAQCLALMWRPDALQLNYPFAYQPHAARPAAAARRSGGGRRHVRRLMRKLGIEAI